MIFGEENSFAIEIHLSQGEDNVFGQYCYWLRGEMIGDIEQHTVLTAIIGDLENISFLKEKRTIKDINSFSPNQIIDALTHKILDVENSYFHIDDNRIDDININYSNTPCMDGYHIFLLEDPSFDWFLAKDIIDQKYYNFKIPKGEFYKCIKAAQEWIKNSTQLILKN